MRRYYALGQAPKSSASTSFATSACAGRGLFADAENSKAGTGGERTEDAVTAIPTKSPQDVPESFWLTNPRTLLVVGNTAYVPLTKGAVAVIDAEDAPDVGRFNWHLAERGSGLLYAARSVQKDGQRSLVYLHMQICPTEKQVDHRDGDGLNNRRLNLRPATGAQNVANMKMHARNRSGAKGVWRHGRKWRATIQRNGKNWHLGGFDTVEEASAAYQAAARELHGEFAR